MSNTKPTTVAPLVRLRAKSQVTIPKEVIKQLNLSGDEIFVITADNGKIVLAPKTLLAKASMVKFTAGEQKILLRAKAKIDKINNDLLNSKGLTDKEIAAAAKAGLIDADQGYFWTETWQKGDREAERDYIAGRRSPSFDNIKDALAYLHSEAAKV